MSLKKPTPDPREQLLQAIESGYRPLFEKYRNDLQIARDISEGLTTGRIRVAVDPFLGNDGPSFSFSAQDDSIFVNGAWLRDELEAGETPTDIAEESAAIIAHEMRHALNYSSGRQLNCKEDEITACVEGFLFFRRLLRDGHAPGLNDLNSAVEYDSCEPWWDCPIRKADHDRVASKVTRALHEARGIRQRDVLKLMFWHGAKTVPGGWDAVTSFCEMNINPGAIQENSIFGDGSMPRKSLRTLIQQGEAGLAVGSVPPSQRSRLRKNLDILRRELAVWSSGSELALRREFYREELLRLKEAVEAESSLALGNQERLSPR